MATTPPAYPTLTVGDATIRPTILHRPAAGRTGRAVPGYVVELELGDDVFTDEFNTLADAQTTAREATSAWTAAKAAIAALTGDTEDHPEEDSE